MGTGTMKSTIRVMFTAGGSGGHVFPLLAVLSELQTISETEEFDVEVRYVGPNDYSLKYIATSGIPISTIVAGKSGFLGALASLLGFFQALWILLWYMPDVVLSKGSYGSVPVVFAAWLYRIPVVIHETDSIPGNANRVTARCAQKILVSFARAKEFFDAQKTIMVGNPVRPDLMSPISQEAAKTHFGFDPSRPLLLILGGSQGAVAINEFLVSILPQIMAKTQILHQVGDNNFNSVQAEAFGMMDLASITNKNDYRPVKFFEGDEYREALYAADLIISRAGGAIFEFAAVGRPSILIPIDGLANNHQVLNAQEYAEYGGAEIFEQQNLLPHLFLDRLFRILDNPAVREKMIEGAKRFAAPRAAENIAREILLLATHRDA
ncbi:MAG: UDP-N-acetylglucosamine--N-acetylmuramyl-(pentapeptide) pyrophosphoryl-undecaprenol N-acetylglucosamine transferase [Patescibacteria group bacterium]|nr:UDP-N-acetylglucosamine--N-acetylmuramyl-(pentapeptide) pyrophosphoryl-undecaprenol N-acetylglucosamine transferase [Patescibacteria group bacterium]MDE2437879.1 UDP-N-acetylglucosamine--N-acetylmuramyl-(pentapeptide) pyrophosphoryl-undecaprenol N-acetylglucosamine transferase [Patescibacteria group bacterium]